ncbi:MAG: hypothetical protein IOC82_03675 [Aestuariivirga sp.]|uniref:hypothetical protein n=1 Tax=Aestuariivirga sp. TaxID=2650926 RepID=UPI0025BE7046|nr:hypothetical protein [Aestuariivirga sp.]MCA3560115.1 hypothetical protein [Aestuariivirga sp.]
MNFEENMQVKAVGRRGLMGLSVAAAAAALAAARPARAEDAKPMLMFVQLSGGVKVDEAAKTVRLVNVTPHTLYFADRPERLAGHIRMDAYLEEWTSKAGKDNFAADPPNAALSVYEEGQSNNTLAIVEILDPRMDGKDLVYTYKLVSGKPPATGGETALFIDWIGVGGGVGVGFHGVGVGVRGPGIR